MLLVCKVYIRSCRIPIINSSRMEGARELEHRIFGEDMLRVDQGLQRCLNFLASSVLFKIFVRGS